MKDISDHLNLKFGEVYTANKLTIDKSEFIFWICIFIRGKPHKKGIKIFELHEAKNWPYV